MGSNCSCFNSGNIDEKQFPEEFFLPSAEQKLLQSMPGEIASSTLDVHIDSTELKNLQSLIRGFIDRKQFRNINHLKLETSECPPLEVPQSYQEVPYNKLSEYQNPNTSKIIEQLGAFQFDNEENLKLVSKGPVLVESQSVYIGQWDDNGSRHGRGCQYWADGSVYEGEWQGGKANGRGRLIHANGDVYEGRWENGRANGFGVYLHHYGSPRNKDTTICGARYEGEWKNDKQHGKGVEVWPDGARYSGVYENGLKHGRGKFEWSDGSLYEGDFCKNTIQGQGEYSWSDGRVFKGNWKDNKMHGFGVFTWSDGRKYEGEYLDDKKHGFGIFTWKDGRKYEGYWHSGKQHGQGVYTCSNGISKEGVWHNGKKVNVIEFANN